MSIQFQCSGCFRQYSVNESFAGKKIRCKDCGVVVQVPAAEEEAWEAPPPPKKSRRRSRDADFGGHELEEDRPEPKPKPVRPRRAERENDSESAWPARPRAPVDESAVISPNEVVLALLCSGVACFISLIYLIQGKPKAIRYVGLAMLCGVVHLGLFILLLLLGQSGEQP